ncbi:hypothetical protein L484_012527 [Morus notabilis]|uniref:Uncharacterized protein n=1 Tax=Morus notabilis TaxID=981085 RepID=W9QMG9_9ROSA|nr:hypothetical protein L484_012527 [Morus notabilis]
MQKVAGQFLPPSSLSRDVGFQRPAVYQRHAAFGNYSNAALQYPAVPTCRATTDLSRVSSVASPISIQAPAEKGNFVIDFLMGGVSAAVSKTTALIQLSVLNY